MINHS